MITARAWLLLVFSLLLAMSHLLMGAEEGPGKADAPFTLKATGGTVDAHRLDGSLLQSLPCGGEEPDEFNSDTFTIVKDMDFDGHPDIGVLFSRGAQNIYYDGWLWREDAGCFVQYEGMREVSSPGFDAERKRVTSFTHVSASDSVTTEYAWENGRLVLMEETVREFSPESETFSIRRRERGGDGEMRLVEEKTLSPDEMEASLNGGGKREGWEPEPPEITGLNLIVTGLPEETSPVDIMTLYGGEWWLQQRLDDRPMFLESRRLPAAEFHEIAVEHHIRQEWPLAREIRVEPFPELAEKLTYPALKAEFLNGENEDTDQFAAAMVFTDDWAFWFVLEADIDAETSGATLKQEMGKILLGVESVEPVDGDFLPGSGLPVYAINGLDAPDGSPSLMGALIRIKKTVSPEQSSWLGDGRLAYRFDGVGEVAGERALTFSFGEDSADEFTAVRHFAVDAAGAVYARVPAEGAEYRRVDEALPVWLGQFRKDGILLEIGTYREGPLGYYFGGLFSGEGMENKEVLAAVDGRFASKEELTFALDSDDSAIDVSVDDTADEALTQLAGRYVASGEDDADSEESENTEDREDDGESTAREFPLVNKLGFTIAFLRTTAHNSEPIAVNVADGATVMLDDETWWELWRGSRLLVKNAEDENDSAPALQFAHYTFSKKVDSFALVLFDGVPTLQYFEDGRQVDDVVAGLPLEELLYGMEIGMEPGSYASRMTPLEADGWESYPFAVRTGMTSWRLLPPGPVFTENRDGVKRLSSVSFGRDNRRIDISIHNDGAYDGTWHRGMWHAAKTADAEKGFAERYILNDDGTFVHAASDFRALEQEREFFKSGTWFVTDNELLLDVRERWILPVGGVENIAPSDTVFVVDDLVKRTYSPPEKEIHSIAQAEKDAETGRQAITIDGAMFYNFDGRADFLGRYNELRRAQKIDFSNLKNVLFTFSSGAGAWRTTLAIQPDGAFNGQYSDANMGEQGDGYPGGTVYICNFSGTFSPPEKADEDGYAYTLKCTELSQEGTPEEEKIIDGVKYINAPPYGLENALGADGITLFLPGTPYDKLPESYLRGCGIEFEDGEIPVLEESMLYFPKDGDFHGASGDDSGYRMYGIEWK